MAVPYMPLYVADYMADTAHLSTVEHGAYLLLIMTYWQRGEKLPNDDRKLARIAGLGPREWARVREVISEFFQVDCSGWFHSRIETELHNLRAKSLKKRNGGLARAKQMHSNCSAPAQLIVDTDTSIPLAKAKGGDAAQSSPSVQAVESDSGKAFWDAAKAYLGPRRAAMIGKWVKTYGQPETAKAITAAQIERAVDPVPYIERVLRGAPKTERFVGV